METLYRLLAIILNVLYLAQSVIMLINLIKKVLFSTQSSNFTLNVLYLAQSVIMLINLIKRVLFSTKSSNFNFGPLLKIFVRKLINK